MYRNPPIFYYPYGGFSAELFAVFVRPLIGLDIPRGINSILQRL
jgi:hypothetical protein